METFAAIVVAAVVVPLVLLGIFLVEVLTGFILVFPVDVGQPPGCVHSGDPVSCLLGFGLAGRRGEPRGFR
jgi:hypothetical protein